MNVERHFFTLKLTFVENVAVNDLAFLNNDSQVCELKKAYCSMVVSVNVFPSPSARDTEGCVRLILQTNKQFR